MGTNNKNILPIFILFSFTLFIGIGSLYVDFPTMVIVFINLIFISIFFQNQKLTLYTGLIICILYTLLCCYPFTNENLANKKVAYVGTIFLLLVCTGFSFFILDINYRTNQSLKHFFLLYENATEGILIADEQGKIVMANPTSCQFFGYSERELINKPIEILIPEKARQNHPHLRMEYVKNPSHREMGKGRDLTGLKKDGSLFPIEISLSSYRDKRKTFVIAFIIDISVRKQNERIIIKNNEDLEKISAELSILNEDLEKKVEERTINLRLVMSNLEKSQLELKEALSKEKELNEIKSRFVSMASHEFRTPLSTVLSSASLLEKYQLQEEQPKRDKHIKRIKESVRNLNEILEDFLSLGKLDEQKIGATFIEENISDIINQAIEEVEVVKKSSQTIHFTFEGETNCKTDKNLLKNICINILTNAIKFSPEESEIIIRVKNQPEKLKIAVQDQGIGIPKEDLTHLFSTFFRSKNAVNIQGTGLGLHIVKRYLDLLNGEISIESELNKGTQVSIIINKPTNSES